MRRESSRRLTGPNLITRQAAAVTEVVLDAEGTGPRDAAARLVPLWQRALDELAPKVGFGSVKTATRLHPGGASLVLEAPVDQLYAAIELNDLAVDVALGEATDAPLASSDVQERSAAVAEALAAAVNPALRALVEAAREHDVPLLWDDDYVSVGHGKHSQTWPADALPVAAELPWTTFQRVPIALITGTNGKTTTSRMLTRIVRTAGKAPGSTSTDAISVNEVVIDSGDWTGPGAARTVLRHPEVDVAVLETARGGILRRGLGVERADVAIVTNVDADHLGDYGINTVADMALAKAVVGTVVPASGRVVLCADDPYLAALDVKTLFAAPVVWFGLGAEEPGGHARLREHIAAGGEAWLGEDGSVVRYRAGEREVIVAIADIPACFGGAAPYNVLNALGAAAMASGLGIDDADIARGLSSFGAKPSDNPGRADLRVVGGVRVLLDFGHNPHGIRALIRLTEHLRSEQPGHLWLATGHAGDRTDDDIMDLCRAIAAAKPHRIFVREMRKYLRGRALGEMSDLFERQFTALGVGDIVRKADSEVDVLRQALAEAAPGDLVVITIHSERDEVDAYLRELGAQA